MKTGTIVAVSLLVLGLVLVVVVVGGQNKVTAPNPSVSTQTSAWGSLFNLGTAVVGVFTKDEKVSAPAGTKGTYKDESFEDYVNKMFGPGSSNPTAEA